MTCTTDLIFAPRTLISSKCRRSPKKKKLFSCCRSLLCYAVSKLPDSPHKAFKYAHYQNLIYKTVFGFDAKELRKKRRISNSILVTDRLSGSELIACSFICCTICNGLLSGASYTDIKENLRGEKYERYRLFKKHK